MRTLFKISVVLSGFVTVWAIWMVQRYTYTWHPPSDELLWSGTNPALFFIVWPLLIILYFFLAMMFVFEALHRKWHANRKGFIRGYVMIFLVLMSFTVFRIVEFKRMIQPYFVDDPGYLNSYSNYLFFNVWTLLAVLCICAIASFYLGKRENGWLDKYKKLMTDFINEEIAVDEFERNYLALFKNETAPMDTQRFQILNGVFEAVDCYCHECQPGQETAFEISEQQLRKEVAAALDQLEEALKVKSDKH